MLPIKLHSIDKKYREEVKASLFNQKVQFSIAAALQKIFSKNSEQKQFMN